MNPRRKPIFARHRRNAAQPHWLWVAVSLATLVAVTLFDMKSDCSVIVSPLKESQAETVPPEIRTKLLAARKQCGLAQ